MSRLSLELIPSKPLPLSSQALKILAQTFEKHEMKILEKGSNKRLMIKICFPKCGELKQKIDQTKERIEKTRESNVPLNESIVRTLKTVTRAWRAELYALSSNFLLKITENQVAIETTTRKLSELSLFYFQIQFERIVSYICEAYTEMGENVTFREKHRGLLEKLSDSKNENEYYS